MHIAIIVPAFNAAAFLAEAIDSVMDQTHRDWSLVVVDDGSTDNTFAVATQFRDQRISVIRQMNAGVSAARNAGLAAALAHTERAGSIGRAMLALVGDTTLMEQPVRALQLGTNPDAVLFLDADDRLAPHTLAMLAETLNDSPWASAAVGRYARVRLDGTTRLAPPPPHGTLLERLLTRNLFANGGHLLIRREAVEAAGSFLEYLSYGEDWEYWVRLALLGEFAAVQCPSPLLYVRERVGGACLTRAIDPAASRPALEAIYRNVGIADRMGRNRLTALRRRAEAEIAWTVGRELIRHGQLPAGQRWLARSIWTAPSLRRLLLMAMSRVGAGPFRPYRLPAS